MEMKLVNSPKSIFNLIFLFQTKKRLRENDKLKFHILTSRKMSIQKYNIQRIHIGYYFKQLACVEGVFRQSNY